MGKLTTRSLWNITAALLFFIAVFLPGTIALAGVGDGYPGPGMDDAGATPTLEPLPGQEPAAGSPLAVTAPAIQVWYGNVQEFGALGQAQRWVNILGNAAGATSATYSLNDGPPLPLRLGPDTRRLLGSGDFNIEIDRGDLDPGPNTVTITAANGSGEDVEVVTINYTANSIWPLPYEINWSTVNHLQDAVQVVDGKWLKNSSGVRTVEIGYDRILALGDVQWTSYEITVPITIHKLDPSAWGNPTSHGPGFGLILRWQGHTQDPPLNNSTCSPGSPSHCGWLPEDGSAWYAFKEPVTDTVTHVLNLNTSGGYVESTGLQMNVPDTYIFKLKVEKKATSGSTYALKVWPQGQIEPANYTLQRSTNSDPWGSGSILLVAHHVDATFGNLSVVPIGAVPTYTLTVNTTGEGQVELSPANPNNTYSQGTQVTLTAKPATGWAFQGWSGALSGSTNPVQVVMNGNKTVTATFVQLPPAQYTLTVDNVGEGMVGISPDKPTYAAGEQVTLTAAPATGWAFEGWSGDATGSNPNITLTMDGDRSVTANFVRQAYSLTINREGLGSVALSPDKAKYQYGEQVTLTATPATGWTFKSWSGHLNGSQTPVTITILEDTSITATFAGSATGNLVLDVRTTGGGSVAWTPNRTGYAYGDAVALTATALPGWEFSGWSGDLSGRDNTTTLIMAGNMQVTAHFSRYKLSLPLLSRK